MERIISMKIDFVFSQKLKGIISSYLRNWNRPREGVIQRQISNSDRQLPVIKLTAIFAIGIPGSGKTTLFRGLVQKIQELGECRTDWDPSLPSIVVHTREFVNWLNGEENLLMKGVKNELIMNVVDSVNYFRMQQQLGLCLLHEFR